MKRNILLFGLLLVIGGLHAQEKGQFVLQAEANAGVLFHDLLKDNRKVHPEVALGAVFGYQVGNQVTTSEVWRTLAPMPMLKWLPT